MHDSVSMCVYFRALFRPIAYQHDRSPFTTTITTILCARNHRNHTTTFNRFLDPDLGGWLIISKWFEEAKQENDIDSIIELLELLTKVPMTYSTISTKNVSTPRWVKSLSKHENENISKLALPLFERWQALVNENSSSSKKKSKKLKIAPTILLTDIKRPRNRKSLSWQCDKDLTQVRYFEFYEDERCNVSRPDYDAINGTLSNGVPTSPTAQDAANGGVSARNERRDSFGTRSSNALKRTLSHDGWPRGSKDGDTTWKSLIPIDFAFQVLEPGWNSQEKGFEADRELGVLRVLDLPGTPQTLSEPDIQYKETPIAANNDLVKIIPLEPISPEANHLRDWSHLEWPRPSYGNNANSLLQQQHLQMQQQHALVLQQQQLLQQQQQQRQLLQHQQQLLFLDQQQQQQQQHQSTMFNQSSSSSTLTAFLPPSSKIARFYQPAITTHQMPNNVRSMYPQGAPNIQWVQTNRDLMNMFTVQQHQSHHIQQHPHQ